MRQILMPTDFSENAKNAISYALELFKYERSSFYFLHAYQDAIYNNPKLTRTNLEVVTKSVEDFVANKLEETLAFVEELSPNPRHSYQVLAANNTLVDEAANMVQNHNIDVIVMGTRGETNNPKIVFGSHTLQVLKYVPCPVLAIPENYTYTQPKHILFPTNLLIPYKRRELKLLCEIAAPYRSKIDVLYVSKSDKLSMRQEDNFMFLKDVVCQNQIELITESHSDITEAIYKNIEKRNTDMLVMVNSRQSFFETLLMQSPIDKLSLHVGIPFLVMQNVYRN
ncbi:Nucleotide-binding universal stress protein, UspA family [Bizionia echini]|uniref:Nucleotide-binding universal stress protein, UspA family n=1 Tax=Bizionia echini TaxID=649333 RepID=A0A1I4ZVA0_9FLAO|nr:universal stress protein [Bizionia echini]SFN54097.1 Nucleotide-binding universal stress protein, UspA family [Bizionia echini]